MDPENHYSGLDDRPKRHHQPSTFGEEKLLDAVGGILEDMSVISNMIRQLVAILIEPPAAPENDPPDPDEG